MAPEQTGRMNRSIDARSDLYSLGITFYEMLTGTLPFTAADPMEWVHCHIARQPVPPDERVAGIPGPLSAIVMKLLAKTAEDRYQTAAGVEADLRRCLAEWEAHRRIDPFPLGAHDVSDRLLIPEKLYGREREIDTLVAAFDRVVNHGATELVLVSGYSGIGKSSLVNELHKQLVPPRGLFAAGKFDQYKRNIPYATLAQAFQSLVHQILSKSDAEMKRWRSALLDALGPNGQLMVNLIPELALVIGEQSPVPELPPQDRQNRFQLVFRRLLGVFARPEHPLALFLDDLQWLDTATLDLIEHLVTHPEVRHLLLVGAYRDNEVSPSHPLARMLATIREAGREVQEILLAPLMQDDRGAAAWRCAAHGAWARAPLGWAGVREDRWQSVLHDAVLDRPGGGGAAGVRSRHGGLDLGPATYQRQRLHRQRRGSHGRKAEPSVPRNPEGTRTPGLPGECRRDGYARSGARERPRKRRTRHSGKPSGLACSCAQDNTYSFLHDRVQEAAYALIAEGERAMAHLRIGRLLAARTPAEELEDSIFEIVNQFDRSAALITSPEEREQVAKLNLRAGKRAKAGAAYAAALQYFATGRALLTENGWDRCYQLTFDLELNWAECEYLTGELALAEERLSALSRRDQTTVDAAAVACVRLNLYTNLDQSDSAVEVGLEYLRRGDGQWSLHPTAQDVRQEYDQLWQRLGSGSIEALLDLPLMADPDKCATMDVLTVLTSPALFTDLNLFRLVVGRMAALSLEHGNSDGSCLAYAWLGGILGTYFGDYRGRVSLWQAWFGSGRKAWPRPVQSACLPRVCRPRRQLDAEPVR